MGQQPTNTIIAVDDTAGIEVEVLPFVRMPILDRRMQLMAYDIRYQPDQDGLGLAAASLQLLGCPGLLEQLTSNRLAFLTLDATLLHEHADLLRFGMQLGPRVDAALACGDAEYAFLRDLAARGVPVMIDNLSFPDRIAAADERRLAELAQLASHASIDTGRYGETALVRTVERLRRMGVVVVAACLDEHRDQRACMDLGFDGFEGAYLFKPPPARPADSLKPSRLNVLRLLAAVQNPDNGPVELEALIRNDVVLSYKLLGCVNSAYFGLPHEIKSLQQAAVYFGVTRIRNWVHALALGDLDDAPPELLKQALLRARMGELLGRQMPAERREMAFTVGLFSLLDSILGIPMVQVLAGIPVADAVRRALIDGAGPLAEVLEQIRAWEGGDAVRTTRSGGVAVDLAELYLDSLDWAEHVYSHVARKAA